jgi:hypothetical protein
MSGVTFESLHRSGRSAVLAGKHRCEDVPWVSGRWGRSVVSILDGDAAASLDALTAEMAEMAGPGHWCSGLEGRAHVTIRALEPYSEQPVDPDRVARSWSAFERVFVRPLQLSLDGLIVAPAGVMLRCTDLDGGGDSLRRAYGRALGPDGWFEDAVFGGGRDPIWYCTLVHFAGPISDPADLVGWVEDRTDHPLGRVELDTFSLCRWTLDAHGMAPTRLATKQVGTRPR